MIRMDLPHSTATQSHDRMDVCLQAAGSIDFTLMQHEIAIQQDQIPKPFRLPDAQLASRAFISMKKNSHCTFRILFAKKFNRSGISVSCSSCKTDCSGMQSLSRFIIQNCGRSFFNNFLIPALKLQSRSPKAKTCPYMISDNLNFNVSWIFKKTFNKKFTRIQMYAMLLIVAVRNASSNSEHREQSFDLDLHHLGLL